jgi:hypothetical protein
MREMTAREIIAQLCNSARDVSRHDSAENNIAITSKARNNRNDSHSADSEGNNMLHRDSARNSAPETAKETARCRARKDGTRLRQCEKRLGECDTARDDSVGYDSMRKDSAKAPETKAPHMKRQREK